MASPPADGGPQWTATPWLPFVYAEIVRSPDSFGVLILGDRDREPRLVAFGSIREELWRFHRSPRSAAGGMTYFRYVETRIEGEAGRLAAIIREELTKAAGHPIAWKDLPEPLTSRAGPNGMASLGRT